MRLFLLVSEFITDTMTNALSANHLIGNRSEISRHLSSNASRTFSKVIDGGRVSDSLCETSERLIARWLEKLLQHFGIRELGQSSSRELAALIAYCCSSDADAEVLDAEVNDASCGELSDKAVYYQWLQDEQLLDELKRRVVRLAGAQLNNTFDLMAPEVVDFEDAECISMFVDGRELQGLRYEKQNYRLVETYESRHRLQAFCLAQTLSEQKTAYIITRSDECFAVWVDVQAFPHRRFSTRGLV